MIATGTARWLNRQLGSLLTVTAADLDELRRVFFSRGWETLIFHPAEGRVLDRVSRSLAVLNARQRRLYMSLLEKYLYISGGDFIEELYRLSEAIRAQGNCILVPLKSKKETGPKSGDSVCYGIKSVLPEGDDPRITLLDSPFSSKVPDTDGTLVIMVDDFVGSGDTFDEVYREFRAARPNARVVLAALVVQERGRHMVERHGVRVLTNHVRGRAISDRMIAGDVAENLSAYDDIERLLDIDHGVRRGYGNSEALVTLQRTPDNTLPIFWKNKQGPDLAWLAPFPRR